MRYCASIIATFAFATAVHARTADQARRRAGFINKSFDLMCLQQLVEYPNALTECSSLDLVELAGSQGVELLNWIAMRGALSGKVRKVHSNYHVPISNTATGVLLLENASGGPA